MTTFRPLSGDPSGMVYAWGLCQHTAKYKENYDMKASEAILEDLFGYFEASWTEGKPQMLNLSRHLDVFSGLVHHSQIVFLYLNDIETNPTPKLLNIDVGGGQMTDKERDQAIKKIKETANEYFLSVAGMIPLYIQDDNQRRNAVQVFLNGVTAEKTVPEMRVRALLSLFNVCEPLNLCLYEVLITICELASETKVFHMIAPYSETMEQWVKGWGIAAGETRRIYKVLSIETPPGNKARMGYLFKYLQSFQFESDEVIIRDESVLKLLKTYFFDTISSPTILFVTHFRQLRPFTVLRQCNETIALYAAVVEIMDRGTLAQFDAFASENNKAMAAANLNIVQLREKLILLNILDLCQTKKRSLKDFSDQLNLSLPDAEKYLIQAIASNLINAKISHKNQSIYIAFAKPRAIAKPQWFAIKKKLGHLIDIVDATISRREGSYAGA